MVTEVQHEIQMYRSKIEKLKSVILVAYLKALAERELNEELITYLEQEIDKLDM
jgi:hypothetical protein